MKVHARARWSHATGLTGNRYEQMGKYMHTYSAIIAIYFSLHCAVYSLS